MTGSKDWKKLAKFEFTTIRLEYLDVFVRPSIGSPFFVNFFLFDRGFMLFIIRCERSVGLNRHSAEQKFDRCPRSERGKQCGSLREQVACQAQVTLIR